MIHFKGLVHFSLMVRYAGHETARRGTVKILIEAMPINRNLVIRVGGL